MARIRSIKPEFPHSESMGRVSRDARLTFVLLWTIADDAGRLRGNSRMLASLLYPYDADAIAKIDGWMTELERQQCIVRYIVDGNSYIQICNWLSHQKIDRPSASKIPAFDEPSRALASIREASTSPREASSEEGKGRDREGKGMDRTGADDERANAITSPTGRMDVWFEELFSLYPEHRRRRSRVVIDAFIAALEGHADAPWMRWERMRANLISQKAGAQWAKDGGDMVPSLENWLTKGAWEEKHKPATAQKAAGDDEFLGYGIPSRSELKRREAQRKAEDEQYERDKAEGKIPASLTAYIEQQKAAKLG